MTKSEDLAEAILSMASSTGDELGPAVESIMRDMTENNAIPREAMGIEGSTVEGLYTQAYHNYNAGRYKDAAKVFHLLQMLDGMEPNYPLGLGACYHMLEEYQNALAMYALVGVSDPENPIPHYHASDCYIKMDLIPAAIAELQIARGLCGAKAQYAKMRDRAAMTIKSLQEKGKAPEREGSPTIVAPE